jgi:tRNA(Arg) A34 adenosine deaminase TadA
MITDNTITVKNIKYINILQRLATSMERVASSRIASCLVYKNDIISFGFNQKKTHPFQAKYCKNESAIYLHSETDCIKNALKHVSLNEIKKSTLYICRMRLIGNKECFGLARPCDGCARAIATFSISRVVYTCDDGNIVSL